MEYIEVWKSVPIEPYAARYEVSSHGRVRRTRDGKLLRDYDNGKGRLMIDLSCKGTKRKCKVHRLVAGAFVPNPEGYDTVDHINMNTRDNRACNLRWMSLQENIEIRKRVWLELQGQMRLPLAA